VSCYYEVFRGTFDAFDLICAALTLGLMEYLTRNALNLTQVNLMVAKLNAAYFSAAAGCCRCQEATSR